MDDETTGAAGAALTNDDRASSIGTVVVAVIFAGFLVTSGVLRVIDVFRGDTVTLLAPFVDETAQLPIGPDGAMRDVMVDTAYISAPDIPMISLVSLVGEVIVGVLAGLVTLACVAAFCLNIARRRVFARANTALLTAAAVAIGAGWALSALLRTMALNGAFASISARTYDNVLFEADMTPLFIVLVIGAIAGAFRVGEKLQRDTEGLV